ncbi:hypothetical protein [Natronorubrum sp. FCH18a]|uniref:hypothetical protein n=1 Tax=Natronorubrum sp. FCH18a TaxID=3447018 RepID=UPI003F51295F
MYVHEYGNWMGIALLREIEIETQFPLSVALAVDFRPLSEREIFVCFDSVCGRSRFSRDSPDRQRER